MEIWKKALLYIELCVQSETYTLFFAGSEAALDTGGEYPVLHIALRSSYAVEWVKVKLARVVRDALRYATDEELRVKLHTREERWTSN